jgi:hypothetical protein
MSAVVTAVAAAVEHRRHHVHHSSSAIMKRKLMPGRNFERCLFNPLDSHFTLVLVYVSIVAEIYRTQKNNMTKMLVFVLMVAIFLACQYLLGNSRVVYFSCQCRLVDG